MKIVIDVSNWLYNAIMEHREPVYSQSLGDAVRDGTPLDEIVSGLEAHKWNKDEGSKAIYNSAIDDAITYVEECTNK